MLNIDLDPFYGSILQLFKQGLYLWFAHIQSFVYWLDLNTSLVICDHFSFHMMGVVAGYVWTYKSTGSLLSSLFKAF